MPIELTATGAAGLHASRITQTVNSTASLLRLAFSSGFPANPAAGIPAVSAAEIRAAFTPDALAQLDALAAASTEPPAR